MHAAAAQTDARIAFRAARPDDVADILSLIRRPEVMAMDEWTVYRLGEEAFSRL